MNSNSVLLFIYELFYQGIRIWVQNNNIKLFIPEGNTLTDDQKSFLTFNRDQIYSYLDNNQIYSKQNSIAILKSECNECELSFAQERLWFIEKYEEGTNAYNIPAVYRLHNNIKLDVLERSVVNIVNRHEILRTVIKENNEGAGYQVVLDKPLTILKVTVTDQEQLDQALFKEVNHIYDLSMEYPIRACLYKLAYDIPESTDEYYLSIVIHHIAFDGWSHTIFFRELQIYYNYYLNKFEDIDSSLSLPSLNIQYKDFAKWQRYYLSGIRLSQQLDYWKDKLSNYEILNLITDKPRPNLMDYRGQDIRFELEESISISLRELAKSLKVSLFSLLLSAYYLMLRSYTNQDDITIGTPVANRHYNQIENMIGFFVNSLALRTRIDPQTLITKFIEDTGNKVGEAQLHQELPFEKLVEELALAKDTSRHPIFQVMFVVQGFGGAKYNLANTQVENNLSYLLQPYVSKSSIYNVARFDITTLIDDSQDKLIGCFNYAVSLYTETTINGYIETYKVILTQLASLVNDKLSQEQTRIAHLQYLNIPTYDQLINVEKNVNANYKCDKTLHMLFEEQVGKTPDSIAVVYEDKKLTFTELNKRANQLASYLKRVYSVNPDTMIILCLDRSELMLIAILGTLKAGCAYVPIDPNYPSERIKYILADTSSKILLSNESHQKKLEHIVKESSDNIANKVDEFSDSIEIVSLDNNRLQEQLSLELDINPTIICTSNNLAYVIYTSGTTGNPKGVLQIHSNVVRLFSTTNSLFNFSNQDTWVLFHSYVFDFSVWEIWGALLYGGKLVVPTQDQIWDLATFYKLCNYEQITILNQTPSSFYQLIHIAINQKNDQISLLRYLILGGEALNLLQLKLWFNYYDYNKPLVVNMYGITETTVHVTYKAINANDIGECSYIGKALSDLKSYVLDKYLNLLPIGGIGELYVGGAGLARGYLNQSTLTAQRFVPNPFQTKEEKKHKENSRLYKTGDLVRLLQDYSLEYLGRNDFQVKIRGYRIELGEIEAALSSYPDITQSVVLVYEHYQTNEKSIDNKYLVGYYVSEFQLDEEAIRSYLKTRLPEYMVPSLFVYLEKLPLTINGKLNRSALPIAKFINIANYIPPRNELEHVMCQIFSEVLDLDKNRIGIKDDFFRLGGNSILAIRLASKINHYYRAHLKVSDIFAYKNIELLLLRILQTRNNYQSIVKLNDCEKTTNIFMIHPGIGGCEVYFSLADKLKQHFNCYGIDSYNLYQDIKIENLHMLAKYYLTYIDQVMVETCQTTYHLLGWSLGGQIALEIASVLEQEGNKDIRVYILDSVLYSDTLFSTLDMDVEDTKKAYKEDAILKGYDKLYIEKTLLNIEIEKKLVKQKISHELIHAHAILFKAMLGDQKYKIDEYNNIDKSFKNKSNIKLVKVNDAHHGNILQREDLLISEIISFNQQLISIL